MVQLRDCRKIMVKRTLVPLLALYKVSMNSAMDTSATLPTQQQLNNFICIYYIFLAHFHCGYRNPVTKIQLCFSSIPSLNTVARTNTVLIHNKTSNREREEKCNAESHKDGISSAEKLLSTRMSQEWTWVNVEVPGADISWKDVPEKKSGSPTDYFVCTEGLFPPLPNFWTPLISSGVRTMLPLSLLLWPLIKEALHYFRNTRTFWAENEHGREKDDEWQSFPGRCRL